MKKEFNMKTDTQLQQDVRDEIRWDARVTPTDIGVSVKDGVVTLNGKAPHYMEKTAAEEAAQRVCGVRAVANEIQVKFFDDSFKGSDEEIAEAAINALKWSYGVPDGIKVSVAQGCITLKGKAEWAYQKEAARSAVKSLMGVNDVINEVVIKSVIEPSDIKTRIEAAFKRSAESEGKGISVEVNGDRVTLTGSVHSIAEKDDARWAAFCAPGISKVDNNLRVNG